MGRGGTTLCSAEADDGARSCGSRGTLQPFRLIFKSPWNELQFLFHFSIKPSLLLNLVSHIFTKGFVVRADEGFVPPVWFLLSAPEGLLRGPPLPTGPNTFYTE